jgi:hypothetical protein
MHSLKCLAQPQASGCGSPAATCKQVAAPGLVRRSRDTCLTQVSRRLHDSNCHPRHACGCARPSRARVGHRRGKTLPNGVNSQNLGTLRLVRYPLSSAQRALILQMSNLRRSLWPSADAVLSLLLLEIHPPLAACITVRLPPNQSTLCL